MRSLDDVWMEIGSLSTALLQTQDEGVAKSLTREALEWAAGLANCRPTDFIIEPPNEFDVIELGDRAATELAQGNALKVLAGLSAAQLDGQACVWCGRAAAELDVAMVPLRVVGGVRLESNNMTLFVCDPDCRVQP